MDQKAISEPGIQTSKPVCVSRAGHWATSMWASPGLRYPILHSGLLGSPSLWGNTLPVGKAVPDEMGERKGKGRKRSELLNIIF